MAFGPMTVHRNPAHVQHSGRTCALHFARALLLGLLGVALTSARAQEGPAWPHKTIRWIVVAPGGSSLDVIARAMQDKLREALGQAVVVENKPQAGGTVGTAEVAQSAPDGHTWVLSYNGPLAYGPHLYARLPYQPLRDLQPVMLTTSQPNVIAVNAELPVHSLQELTALFKSAPGHYNYASVGNGSSSHLTLEYILALTDNTAVHVPFNGSPPAVMSLIAGQTQVMATVPAPLMAQVKQGRIRLLAVTSRLRYSLLPDVPTVAESGLAPLRQFEALAWNGVLVAAGTPRPIVDRLNQVFNQVLHDPVVQERLRSAGLEPVGGTPEQFAQLMRDESAKWAPIIKRSGARID